MKEKLIALHKIHWAVSQKESYGKKVVFTTGVFDIPHIGHPRYLKSARETGDLLVVGIHSDKLVKKRKGENRPVIPFEERAEFISYFPFVDYILELSDQHTVIEAIMTIRPNVLVVSETTKDPENCPEEMIKLFKGLMEIRVLGPQSQRHSTDFIEAMMVE